VSEPIKLWGGRFAEGPSQLFERYSRSLHFDCRLLNADIRGSKAFANALLRVGILNDEEHRQITAGLQRIAEDAKDLPSLLAGATEEDVHTLVIRKLHEYAGAAAEKIHTGRSRNEQVSLDTRLWLREQIDAIRHGVCDLLEALLAIAARYPDAVVPGFTHLRRAQAVLWPHYLLAYCDMFRRDWQRLSEVRQRVNVLPLGSGALAGSGFPLDRDQIAYELEFDGITTNSMDVSADRDFVLDFLHAASMLALHLSRFAEDWILYSSEEFGWLELGDAVTSGSSLMPQKKNPDSLELIRGKCGRVYGSYASVFMMMKGLPMTYNRDMQEDKEQLFDAADTVMDSVAMAAEVVKSATLRPEVSELAAEDGWLVATDLAEALARDGVPFHTAHQLVGRLVLKSVQEGRKPASWTAEELAAFSPEFRGDLVRYLQPREGMKTREAPGGTGPEAVAKALQATRTALTRMREQTPIW
jgi:argininosuccinate lyase